MSGDRVIYNGIEMAAEWPARIEAAQNTHEYIIGGTAYARIPYGKEEGGDDFALPCHDCSVLPGQYHVELMCDMEECPRCHDQVIGCDCPYEDSSNVVALTETDRCIASSELRELLKRIGPALSGYTVFLETASGRFLPLASDVWSQEVASVVITYIRDDLSPWETEEPVKKLAERLSAQFGVSPVVLLSRRLEPFAGYYVRIP